MTIRGELRGTFPHESIERKEARDLRDEDRRTIDQIERLMGEHRWETVGSGRSADVIFLDIWKDTQRRPWVVKQENRRTREQDKLGCTIEDEFRLQVAAFDIIEQAKRENPNKAFANVPQPFAVLRDEKHTWLLIDYIPGETLFERTLRQHILTFISDDEARTAEVLNMRHDELIATCMTEEFLYTLPSRIIEEYLSDQIEQIDQRHWRMVALGVNKMKKGPSVVLSAEQYTAIENTIQEFHRRGLHHRDLHASNLQISEDGKVTILDYGLSHQQTTQQQESSVYLPNVGHEFHEQKIELLVDDQKMKEYWDVARKIA